MQGSLVLTQVPRSCPGPSRLTRCDPGGKHSLPPECLLSESSVARGPGPSPGMRPRGRQGALSHQACPPAWSPGAVRAAFVAELADSEHTLSSRVTDCRAQRGSRGWGWRPCTDHGEPGSPEARGRLLRVPGPGRASCRGLSPVHHDPQAPCSRCPSFLRRLVDRVAPSLGLVLRGTEAIP